MMIKQIDIPLRQVGFAVLTLLSGFLVGLPLLLMLWKPPRPDWLLGVYNFVLLFLVNAIVWYPARRERVRAPAEPGTST